MREFSKNIGKYLLLSKESKNQMLIVLSREMLNADHSVIHLAPVVQTLDSAIHRIKIYLVDNAIGFPNTYPLDSDLSAG